MHVWQQGSLVNDVYVVPTPLDIAIELPETALAWAK